MKLSVGVIVVGLGVGEQRLWPVISWKRKPNARGRIERRTEWRNDRLVPRTAGTRLDREDLRQGPHGDPVIYRPWSTSV
jgi:hypothetical protein